MLIYKTINLVNGKFYIGQTITNNPYYFGSGIYLVRAIKKYGKKNFKREIIQYCNSLKHLNEREQYWIKKLKSQDRNIGYNIENGGNSVGKHSDEWKLYMSNFFKGENNPMFGKIGYWKGKHIPKKAVEKMIKTKEEKGILKQFEKDNPNFANRW